MKAKKAIEQLYHHKTDGGAEYLFDTFIECENGHKEGVRNGKTKYAIRLDGCAALLNAAPELLAALKEAEKHLSNICPNRYNGGEALSTLSQARAAIAKARGQ